VAWSELWKRGIFAPRLWPDVTGRARAGEFARESMLADRLLPLPIDHRYDAGDMDRLTAVVTEVMGW